MDDETKTAQNRAAAGSDSFFGFWSSSAKSSGSTVGAVDC
jgi:hypothetical protein